MNVSSRATLLMALSGAVIFCQTPSNEPQQLFATRNDFATRRSPQPIGALASHNAIPALPVKLGTTGSIPLTLLRFSSCSGRQVGSATSWTSTPFSYSMGKDRGDYFPVKVGPLRYTFWSQAPQFDRPAGGRFQNLVDGVLRHYTSDPVVPVNKRCVRSLSCNSLYDQALRRRANPFANK